MSKSNNLQEMIEDVLLIAAIYNVNDKKQSEMKGFPMQCFYCSNMVYITDASIESIKNNYPGIKEEKIKSCCFECFDKKNAENKSDIEFGTLSEDQISSIMKGSNLTKEQVLEGYEKIKNFVKEGKSLKDLKDKSNNINNY